MKNHSSPREEALEIASETRKDLLSGRTDCLSTLRRCWVIANILDKNDDQEWIIKELHGYTSKVTLPNYRCNISCRYTDSEGNWLNDFYKFNVRFGVDRLTSYAKDVAGMRIMIREKTVFLTLPKINAIFNHVIDKCLFFLNDAIKELQYGGIVEYLMEEIRKGTDEELAKINQPISDEVQSLTLNLSSSNPADWNKVAHSCRKILKILADKKYPPTNEQYTMKDGRKLTVDEGHFINQLCAFVDQKTKGDERKFIIAEMQYFESYLRQVIDYNQMGEHVVSLDKFHANMIAIHTYLIISEILKLENQ